MGACNKMCIALVAVCVLFGCAARLQETTQIKCTGSDGQILYAGPYNEENLSEYIVQVDDWTLAVYRKGACRKVQAGGWGSCCALVKRSSPSCALTTIIHLLG